MWHGIYIFLYLCSHCILAFGVSLFIPPLGVLGLACLCPFSLMIL